MNTATLNTITLNGSLSTAVVVVVVVVVTPLPDGLTSSLVVVASGPFSVDPYRATFNR